MKKNYVLTIFTLVFLLFTSANIVGQSGNGHDPTLVLSYTPSGYTAATTMRQDDGYTTFSKSTINNNGGNTQLFVNFTFDTSGMNVFCVYTTNGSVPTKSNGTEVSGSFSNFSDPNRTWTVSIPNSANTSGTTIEYVFYISNSDLASGFGRVTPGGGYQTTWTEGDQIGFRYTVYESNVSGGGNWSSTSTWNSSSVPNASSMPVEIIGTNAVTLNQDADVENLNLLSGSILNISTGNGLNVTGDLSSSGTLTVNSDDSANTSGSLRVSGSSSGNITYNVNVDDTNWHLVASPFIGEQYDDTWVTNNSIASGISNTNNRAIGTYSNTTDADGDWTYFLTGGGATTFNTGQGYALQRTGAGNFSFEGTMLTTDGAVAITGSDVGGANENKWTLIGNPFPSFVAIADLLTNNGSALDDSREAVYVWNGSSYAAVTTGHIAPGQAFFVNATTASETVTIAESILSHQSSATFYRNTTPTYPKITLSLEDGTDTRTTEINYQSGKTTGLNPRFDLGTFSGQSTSFNIYTHLVSDSEGIDFMIQSLPDSDYESMVIPIGINASSGTQITISAEALNLPSGLNVYLEDKDNGTFTQLNATNAEYTTTLSGDLNGIGRFFLHTSSSALSTPSEQLDNISIYTSSDNNLRIVGIQEGDVKIRGYNILGRQVLDASFRANGVNNVELPNLRTGIYIFQLETSIGKLSKKVIIK